MELPTVATYPSARGRRETHRCVFQERKMRGVATNVYSRKKLEKSERCGLRTLIVKGLGVVFTHEEGISPPRVHHQGRQPSTKCANMTSKYVFFLFYVFQLVIGLFVFFIFLWLTRVFPSRLHILNCDEEIIPTQFFDKN